MGDIPLGVAIVLPPDDGGSKPRKPDIIAGSGTTEDHNATALALSKQATLIVGGVDVRIAFRSAAGLADGTVTTANTWFVAGSRFDWQVDDSSRHVYAEAKDGTSDYEVSVWHSGP
jgi:hypothetical protein